GPIIRSLGLTIFLLNLAAVAANTSRGAQLIAGLILLALLWQLGPHIFRGLSRSEKNVALVGVGAILLLLYAIGTASHLEQPISRWKQSEDLSQDTRLLATRVALQATVDLAPGGDRLGWCGSARADRFSVADRIDPALYRGLSRIVLGKRALEQRTLVIGYLLIVNRRIRVVRPNNR